MSKVQWLESACPAGYHYSEQLQKCVPHKGHKSPALPAPRPVAPPFRGGMTQGLGALDACSQGCDSLYGEKSKKPDVLALLACFAQCNVKAGAPPVAPPGGVVIPGGTVLPGGLTLPAGLELPHGWTLPAGWSTPIPGLPAVIPPGFQIPTGPGPNGGWPLPFPWTIPADWTLPGPLTLPGGAPLPGNLPTPPAPLPEPSPSPAPAPAPAPGPIAPAPAAAAKSETPWGLIIVGGLVVVAGVAAVVVLAKGGGAAAAPGPSENPKPKRSGKRGADELRAEGFTIHENWGDRWFDVSAPQGKAPTTTRLAMLRMRNGAWHSFAKDFRGTGSGYTPLRALYGGLGDVVGSDSALRAYCKAVLDAPKELAKYEGLYAAQSQCFNQESSENPRQRRQTYSDWFIADSDYVLGYNKRGHQVLLKRTKSGIPSGAAGFGSESNAQREIGFMKRQGFFPGFIDGGAKPAHLTWR